VEFNTLLEEINGCLVCACSSDCTFFAACEPEKDCLGVEWKVAEDDCSSSDWTFFTSWELPKDFLGVVSDCVDDEEYSGFKACGEGVPAFKDGLNEAVAAVVDCMSVCTVFPAC
jgi:hypothetical protein